MRAGWVVLLDGDGNQRKGLVKEMVHGGTVLGTISHPWPLLLGFPTLSYFLVTMRPIAFFLLDPSTKMFLFHYRPKRNGVSQV